MTPRRQAAAATVIAAVLLVVLLCLLHLSEPLVPDRTARPAAEIAEIDEEFVDLLDMSYGPSDPSPAYAPEPVKRDSRADVASGQDKADAGKAAAPVPDVVSKRPSEVKRPEKPVPPETGPDKTALAEEEARRKARKGVGDAFKNTSETPDNTSSKGTERGDSGSPEGGRSDANGTGSGTVGGGWTMPRYARVPSEVTGSIILTAIVGPDGHVLSVELTGGKSPAAADRALVQACMAEVKRRRFTRNDDKAPERSTARITYTFR